MSRIKVGVNDRKAALSTVGPLDLDDSAVTAIIEAAWDRYEARDKWYVAMQVVFDGQTMVRGGEKVLLGPYATDAVAWKALDQAMGITETTEKAGQVYLDPETGQPGITTEPRKRLNAHSVTGEVFNAWLLRVEHGTPAQWLKDRKVARKSQAVADSGGTRAERVVDTIAKGEAGVADAPVPEGSLAVETERAERQRLALGLVGEPDDEDLAEFTPEEEETS